MTPSPSLTEATCANCRWFRPMHMSKTWDGMCFVQPPPDIQEKPHEFTTFNYSCALHSPKDNSNG